MIVGVVSPVDHAYVDQGCDSISLTESPAQKLVGPEVEIETEDGQAALTVTELDKLQPSGPVIVAV